MVLRRPLVAALGGMAVAVALAAPATAQVAPAGAVIDLGTGTPPTVGMYTQYSATVTAQSAGLYYTLFAFREDPAYFRFDDASLTAVNSASQAQAAVQTNLLTNPGFEGGTTPNAQDPGNVVPDGWGVVYQTGTVPAAAGTVDSGSPHSGSFVWDDGSVGHFDGIYQTFNAVAGQQYLISFYLSADDPFVSGSANGGGVEMAAYFGACSSADSCTTALGGFTVQQPSAPTIDTTGGDIAPNIFSLGSPAAMASTVTFEGGTLRMIGGSFPDNIVPAPVVLTASSGTVDTSTGSGGFSGVVSGPGSLTIIGSNTFSLTNANTYAGGTVLSGGTLLVGNDAALGTGPLTFAGGTLSPNASGYTIANAAILSSDGTIDTNGFDLTYAGAIAGTGRLVKAGSGTLSLTASNSYTGGTALNVGTIAVTANGALGTGALSFGGGTLQAAADGLTLGNAVTLPGDGTVDTQGFGLTLAGTVDGPGQLTKAGSGTLTLSGANTAAGPTTVAAGTLKAGSTTAFSPNSALAVAGGATLDLNAFGNTVGSIAGAGTVTNTGAAAATLTAGGSNASTTFSGLLADGAAPLALAKAGTGTLTLTGANTYSGGTTVLAGTLGIGNSAALGSGPVALQDSTDLQFLADGLTLANAIALTATDPTIDTGSGTETLSGPITGPGALTKIGTGTLDLTGIDTYAGATEVAAGTLLVDGSIVNSAITVDSGARLGGAGSIKSFTVGAGGTVSLAAQTLTVTGNATFLAGSTYQTTINGDGTGSRLSIGGTASLGGATLDVLAGSGPFRAATYTLLTAAGGVSGTFGTVTTPASLALLRPDVTYGADAVQLTLRPVDFASLAATPNQAAVAAAIQALGPGSPLYDAVVVQDRAGAQQAFAAASGVSQASARSIVETNTRLTTGLVIDRLWDVSGSGLSAQDVLRQFAPDQLPTLVRCYGPVVDPKTIAPPPTYTAWGEGFGSFGHTNAGANAGSLDRSLGGFILGIDAPLGGGWRGGVAGGYTNTSYDSPFDGGQGTVQSVYGSLYGGARYGAIDIRVGTTLGGNFTDGRRTVAFPGFLETERSHDTGYSVQTFGEIGYRINAAQVVVEPVAGAAFLHVSQDGFTEQGGAAALIVAPVDNDLGVTTLGVRGEVAPLKGVPLVAHTFLGWQHVIGTVSPATTLAFAANAANTFSVTGTPVDRDALAAEVALDYRATTALDIGFSYSGLVGEVAADHSIKGRVEYRF